MNREAALKDYHNKIQDYLNEQNHLLEQNYLVSEKEFQTQLYDQICNLCKSVTMPVKYLQVSILRSVLSQDIFMLLISVHNEKYFLDLDYKKVTLDVTRLFLPLINFKRILYDMISPYMGKIQKFDADRIIMGIAVDFFKKKANHMRRYFRDFDQWECIEDIPKCSRLVVKWGEHRGDSETLFLMDMQQKNQEEFIAYNQENRIDTWEPQYNYQSFDNAFLKDSVMQKKNFLFLGMRNGRIENSSWEASLFAGAGFKNSIMENVIFAGCDLSYCDFRNVNLKNAQFIQCKIVESDFRGALFLNIKFEDCEMQNTIFSRQDLAFAGLDAGQLQQIKIEEEPNVFHDGRG